MEIKYDEENINEIIKFDEIAKPGRKYQVSKHGGFDIGGKRYHEFRIVHERYQRICIECVWSKEITACREGELIEKAAAYSWVALRDMELSGRLPSYVSSVVGSPDSVTTNRTLVLSRFSIDGAIITIVCQK